VRAVRSYQNIRKKQWFTLEPQTETQNIHLCFRAYQGGWYSKHGTKKCVPLSATVA